MKEDKKQCSRCKDYKKTKEFEKKAWVCLKCKGYTDVKVKPITKESMRLYRNFTKTEPIRITELENGKVEIVYLSRL